MIYPSVTTVLQPWADFSHIPPAVLEVAAARGTAVHEACANFAKGLFVFGLAPEVAGYVASFMGWFNAMVAEVLLVEERQVDTSFGFHGQNDLIIRAKHGEILLIDLKTPVTKIKTWRIQLSAYHHLAVLNGITPDRTGSLQLNPEGKIAKMTYYENSLTDFNYFLQALNLYRLFNTK